MSCDPAGLCVTNGFVKKILKVALYATLLTVLFFILYTAYCAFSVPELCDLARENPKTSAFIEARKKQWKDQKLSRRIDQQWVSLSRISSHLRNAVIVTEDPNFYHHQGIDYYAIRLAMKKNLQEGEISRGASTITQQLMKNLYLSPSRNPLRKWREAILSIRVEKCVKKNRLLELYLNVIEWGENVYGAEAASRKYFGKSAMALDPAESALLAAMIRNPIVYNPYKKNPRLLKNRNLTLRLMLRAGKLNKSQYETARDQPIRVRK